MGEVLGVGSGEAGWKGGLSQEWYSKGEST